MKQVVSGVYAIIIIFSIKFLPFAEFLTVLLLLFFLCFIFGVRFTVTPFHPKTLLLFLVFQLASINLVTFVAYGVDKRAAQKGDWRVPESNLHTLEFLGGWAGALLGQKFFHHKSKKRSYQTFFWMMMLFEAALVFVILRFLHII